VLDFLFGEGQYGLRFVFAFIVVLGLIGLFTWLARRFGAANLGATTARGRQPRLAVIDAAAVDGRRRLLLIRRDNIEHLLMIGGPTDVVVETNIVRAGAVREAAPGRQPAAADTLPRPVPLDETGNWPSQPEHAHAPQGNPRRVSPLPLDEPDVSWPEEAEPAPMPRKARALDPLAGLAAELSRNPPDPAPATAAMPRVTRGPREHAREAPLREPPLREPPLREPPLREPPVREMPSRDVARELPREVPREVQRELPREMPREVPREVVREVQREVAREAPREVAREAMREPIREVMREPIREAIVREPIREAVREPVMREPVMREPMREVARAPQQPAASEAPFAAAADQNLAEMAHRLEAALRRPGGAKAEARPEPKPRPVAEPAPMAEPSPLEQPPSEARREPKAAPQQRSLYDSLEQEMASLLGRPNSKA
jgi:flagellar protein FliO/FliZ